jgi:hypothetical protein
MILVHNQASYMQIMQENQIFKYKTLSCEKFGKKLEKSHTSVLIRNVVLKTFGNHRDLAEIHVEGVWFKKK